MNSHTTHTRSTRMIRSPSPADALNVGAGRRPSCDVIHTERVWIAIVVVLAALPVIYLIGVPLFERFAPTRAVRAYQRAANPFFMPMSGRLPGFGIVETTGRKSGLARPTPVGGRLAGKTFWFVSGIGTQTHYVRNIEADPRVRVKVKGRWHTGTATLVPEDNTTKRVFWINPVNGFFLWLANRDPVSIRIDLDD